MHAAQYILGGWGSVCVQQVFKQISSQHMLCVVINPKQCVCQL